jgi:hypothetical protein
MDVREIASFVRGAFNAAAQGRKEEGIDYKPFNQYLMGSDEAYDEWLGKGFCRGFSVKYIDCVKSGEEFFELCNAQSMRMDGGNPELRSEIFEASHHGNTNGTDASAFHAFMKERYGFKKDKSQVFGGKSAIVRDGFEFAAHSGCYSIISFPRHSMAAVGSKNLKHFLEPNCGCIIGPKAAFLDAVETFFSHDFVRKIYGMDKPEFSFKVHRFTS